MSSDEDVHQCGRCKQVFHDIDLYFQHKKSKTCVKVKGQIADVLAGGDNLMKADTEHAADGLKDGKPEVAVKKKQGRKRKRGPQPKAKVDIDVSFQVKEVSTASRKLRVRKSKICIHCGYQSTSAKDLEDHRKNEHQDEDIRSGELGQGDAKGNDLNMKDGVTNANETNNTTDSGVGGIHETRQRARSKCGRKPKGFGTPGFEEKSSFPCKECDQVFHRMYLLRRHISNTHKVHKQAHVCKWCGAKFMKGMQHRNHIRHVHNIPDDMSDSCPVCNKVLKSRFHVKRHRESLHTPVGAEDYISQDLKGSDSDGEQVSASGATEATASQIDPKVCFVCCAVCPGEKAFHQHLECHRVWIPDPSKRPKTPEPQEDVSASVIEEGTIPPSEMISYAAQQGGVLNGDYYQTEASPRLHSTPNAVVTVDNVEYTTLEVPHNTAQINQMIQEQTVLNILQEMGQAASLVNGSHVPVSKNSEFTEVPVAIRSQDVTTTPGPVQNMPSQGTSSDSQSTNNRNSSNNETPIDDKENTNTVLDAEAANYICTFCCKLFATYLEVCEHYREEHGMIAVFRCVKESCKNIYNTAAPYMEHSSVHDQKAFICCICNQHYETMELLNMHKSIDHRDVHKTGFYSNGYRCLTCSRCFPTQERLQHHVKHDAHSHKCKTCGKIFKSQTDLMYHEMTHTGTKAYLCDECGTRFVSIPALKKHQRNHNPVRSHVCDVCGTTFNKREHLKRHMLTKHSDAKPFKCTYAGCDRAFKRSDKLSEHMRIHTGDLRFVCEQCGKLYNNRAGLRYHEKTHTRVQVLKHMCNHCDQKFYTQPQLKAHLESVHNEKKKHIPTHKCRVCSLMFYRMERLNRHSERDHGLTVQWKETCPHCGRGFLGKKSLHTHIEERHTNPRRSFTNKRRKKASMSLAETMQQVATSIDSAGMVMSLPNHMVPNMPVQQQQQHQQQAIQISAPSAIEYVPHILSSQTHIVHQGQVPGPPALPSIQQVYHHEGVPPPQVNYQYHTGFMHY